MTIRYVSADRVAASSRFKSETGAEDMAKVWDWLALETDPQHLWTVNAGMKVTADVVGERVTPKQAGSNKWRTWCKASAIYAAKPSPLERKFYALLGIDAGVIVASREAYDLNQFFMRTSLRDPTSTARVGAHARACLTRNRLNLTRGFRDIRWKVSDWSKLSAR